MARAIKPRGSLVFIRPQTADETSSAGIIIPQTVESEIPTSGIVVSAGPDVKDDIKPGLLVLFGAYAATEIEVDREKIWCLRDQDIMSVEDPEAPVEDG